MVDGYLHSAAQAEHAFPFEELRRRFLIDMLGMNAVSQVPPHGAEVCTVVSWSLVPAPSQPASPKLHPVAGVTRDSGYPELDEGPMVGRVKHRGYSGRRDEILP